MAWLSNEHSILPIRYCVQWFAAEVSMVLAEQGGRPSSTFVLQKDLWQ